MPEQARGHTVADVAARYRVGADKVRKWIEIGELTAVNTAASLCGRPRWVVSAEALAAFEAARAGGRAAQDAAAEKADGGCGLLPRLTGLAPDAGGGRPARANERLPHERPGAGVCQTPAP